LPLHVPASLAPPPVQSVQPAPPLPHEVSEVPGSQMTPEQQPLGHDVPVHVHVPDTHCSPVGHSALAPQTQTPCVQPLASIESQAKQD
jgi:hypothetical protein